MAALPRNGPAKYSTVKIAVETRSHSVRAACMLAPAIDQDRNRCQGLLTAHSVAIDGDSHTGEGR